MTRAGISSTNGVVLPDGGPRRLPFRPLEHRPPNFHELFDATTLVFDAFEESDHSTRLICPPFSNLSEAMDKADFRSTEDGRPLSFSIRHGLLQEQIVLERAAGSGPVRISTGFGEFDFVPHGVRSAEFRGRRAMVTLSKDNDLIWIQDWMRYHRDVHGANALLLFDNRSTRYGLNELATAVGSVGGFDTVRVVDWPYRYGPQGDAKGRFWDSSFTQLGVLESARRSYLALAASVLVGDVDELVVPVTDVSVFRAAERSRSGVTAYHGLWVPRLSDDLVGEPPRHRQMAHFERPGFGFKHGFVPGRRYFENKYTVVPSRVPDSSQWNTHAINGYSVSRYVSWRFHLAHYRVITTGWKYKRNEPVDYARLRHRRPTFLRRALSSVDWNS